MASEDEIGEMLKEEGICDICLMPEEDCECEEEDEEFDDEDDIDDED